MMRQEAYRRMTRFVIKVSIIAVSILAIVLFFFIKFRLDTITIKGSTYYSEQELIGRLKDSPLDSNTLVFYMKHRFGEQKRIPYIEELHYEIKDTHTIEIQVYEKILVGCVKVMGQYMYFDKDGYVTDSTQDRLADVPRIIGLEFDRILLYEKLKIQKDSLYNTILSLTKLILDYEIPVDTIEFSDTDEVTLYIDEITVLLGKQTTYDKAISALVPVLEAGTNEWTSQKMIIDMVHYKDGKGGIIAKPISE